MFVAPYDDPLTIAGQGTIGTEILRQLTTLQLDTLDAIFVPVGGGGLIAGIAAYVKALQPDVKIIGVEPSGGKAELCHPCSVYTTAFPGNPALEHEWQQPTGQACRDSFSFRTCSWGTSPVQSVYWWLDAACPVRLVFGVYHSDAMGVASSEPHSDLCLRC